MLAFGMTPWAAACVRSFATTAALAARHHHARPGTPGPSTTRTFAAGHAHAAAAGDQAGDLAAADEPDGTGMRLAEGRDKGEEDDADEEDEEADDEAAIADE